jgi:hypothetical protein
MDTLEEGRGLIHLHDASEQARIEEWLLGIVAAEIRAGGVTSAVDVRGEESGILMIRKGAAGVAADLGYHHGGFSWRASDGLLVRPRKNSENFWIRLPCADGNQQVAPR